MREQRRDGAKAGGGSTDEIELEQKGKFYRAGVDGYYRLSLAPTVENQTSPFAYDPYNQHEVGIGLTMSLDINLGQTIAQRNEAAARLRGKFSIPSGNEQGSTENRAELPGGHRGQKLQVTNNRLSCRTGVVDGRKRSV